MHRRRLAILAALAVLATVAAGGAPVTTLARGTTWTTPVVLDGAGGANGRIDAPIGEDVAAVTYGGVAHVFYSASVGGRSQLRHAVSAGPAVFETLDGLGGTAGRTAHSVGRDVSAALYGGAIHVLYRDDTAGNLRHAWFDSERWRFRTLDGASTRDGRIAANVGESSVTRVFDGRLEVFYLNETALDIRRASLDGTTWSFSTLDGDVTEGGHTVHEVGFTIAAARWGDALHVLYFERDPAYGAALGWAREAVFDGSSWAYRRSFRVNTIVPGKTLTLGVVADDEVYVAYTTTFQIDTHVRWRSWDGSAWSESALLIDTIYGDPSTPALFVVVDGIPTLAFYDGSWGPAAYFTWTGSAVARQDTDHSGAPSTSTVSGGVPRIYWGSGSPSGGCCEALLLRTSRP